jgi:hypothetical protein
MHQVHIPPPSLKLLMVLFLFALECARDAFTLPLNLPLASGGQQLLCCCFLNLIALHLPSFFWNRRVNTAQSIALLEHMIHYYFTLALLLKCFEYHRNKSAAVYSPTSEMIIASQMSLYFLWHVFRELKLVDGGRRHCTLFPRLIEASIYIFAFVLLPVSWLAAGTSGCAPHGPWAHILSLFSTFILPETAAVIFQALKSVRLFAG